MKTIQEQNVFQFSSLFVAACLVGFATITTLTDKFDTEGILFGFSSLIFLLFIYWFNGKLKKLNGFLSSYATTFISYTFLVLLYTLVYSISESNLDFYGYFMTVSVFLIYGYIFNLGISLIVYVLYKLILYFKTKALIH